MPVYQVELYTLPFLAYFSTRAQPGLDGQVPISWSVSKSCSLGQVCGDIIRGRARQHQYSSYRCWFRPKPADVASTSEQATSTTAVVPSTNKRRLTSDVTDMHDGWRLFRSPKSVRSMDICTDDGTQYELIIEISSSLAMSVDQYSDHDWPRGLQAAAWRTDLRVGDEVDVEDLDCNWVEGVVVECDASHTVVHLRGWETSDDIDIAARMVPYKVMPLYSHSKNWREKLEEDDEVEILVVDESSGLKAWKIGTVVELNVPGRTVLVKQSDEAESVAASSSDPADDDRY